MSGGGKHRAEYGADGEGGVQSLEPARPGPGWDPRGDFFSMTVDFEARYDPLGEPIAENSDPRGNSRSGKVLK